MEKPKWFFSLIKKFNQWKLINDSVFKFAHYYIDDANARILLYKRWTSLRLFKPTLRIIASQLKKENTKLFLFYGRFDKIILPHKGKKLCAQLENNGKWKVLPAGHQLLNEKSLEDITKALLQ
jgi:pimeloyl-ACP methyl ester carboxylesterase